MAIIICFATTFVVLLIIFPMHAKAKLHVDLLDGKIEYSVKFLFIKLLVGKVFLLKDKLKIENTANKLFVGSAEEQKKQGLFVRQIIKQLDISRLELYFNFGLQNNFAVAAIICGIVQSIFTSIAAVTISKNPYVHIVESVVPNFKNQECDFAGQILIELSILKIIISKFIANKLHKENIRGK